MNKDLNKLVIEAEKLLENEFQNVDKIALINSEKVLNAFHNNHVSEIHFHGTTGYGYNDLGRDTIDNVYKDIFKAESAIVRTQFISGTHALTVALFAMLRPNDILLSISGKPYDTLDSVIGFNDNPSSLKSYNIKYAQIDLINDDFDYESIEKLLKKKYIKLIEIQRSKGYSTRKSLSIKKLEKVIKLIKKISPKTIIMVDNCYCEFVSTIEPSEIGADLTIGSLIKNLGGGITPNGAYIVGKKDLIELCSERLSVPGEGMDVGPTMNNNRLILQGLYLAPSVVKNSLKVAILTSYLLEKLGFNVEPKYNEERVDIVQNIIFNNKDLLIKYVEGIQSGSAIDSNAIPIPDAMPGYDDLVIMASGSFIQGSSIELSCDGPLRETIHSLSTR
jgi:cystathionine beta-lyase family protein involved in aluminum resistance